MEILPHQLVGRRNIIYKKYKYRLISAISFSIQIIPSTLSRN